MAIELIGLRKRFGNVAVLENIDLHIADGELLALLGPSGSGKTTLLRLIAGLEWPDVGDLVIDGESQLRRGARDRKIGFVFQHYALFRHMSVFDNVAFGLRVRPAAQRPDRAEIQRRVQELLDLVQIGQLARRYPHQLSGGQRQRVALARALAIEPKVLLLDEPFGALDAKVRKDLRKWLRELHDRLRMTTVFVTHDQEEALELADRVVVMGNGRIEQIGSAAEVYHRPSNEFVFGFLGQAIGMPCRIVGGRPEIAGLVIVDPVARISGHERAKLFVRPHDITVTWAADGEAVVKATSPAGPAVRIELAVDGLEAALEAHVPHQVFDSAPVRTGDRVRVSLRRIALFPEGTSDEEGKAALQPVEAAVRLAK